MPIRDPGGDQAGVLPDDPTCQTTQQAGNRPDSHQGQGKGRWSEKYRWDARRLDRPGEKTLGGDRIVHR